MAKMAKGASGGRPRVRAMATMAKSMLAFWPVSGLAREPQRLQFRVRMERLQQGGGAGIALRIERVAEPGQPVAALHPGPRGGFRSHPRGVVGQGQVRAAAPPWCGPRQGGQPRQGRRRQRGAVEAATRTAKVEAFSS